MTDSLRRRFSLALPAARFLDPEDLIGIQDVLRAAHCLPRGATVQAAASAGDGNMNLTLRVRTTTGSAIVKQSRPWVERYPQIAAPDDRVLVEAAFYAATADLPGVAALHPAVHGLLPDDRVMVMEDLGDARDLTGIYAGATVDEAILCALANYLRVLHDAPVSDAPLLANRAMRALNHVHMYALPFQPDNGIDLDGVLPGLADAAVKLLADGAIAEVAAQVGCVYLSDGQTLLHGDFYPGSWMRTPSGSLHVLDPEFAFLGPAEFDVAVASAHLHIASGDPDDRLLRHYAPGPRFDLGLARRMAGLEILRRILGVAQLPLTADLRARVALLEAARELVLA